MSSGFGLRASGFGLVLMLACSHPRTCEDLTGLWRDPAGREWMLLDHGPDGIEAYPMFDDGIPGAAPRVIDLRRGAVGTVMRRYGEHGKFCESRVPAQLVTCGSDGLDLVLADPPPCGSAQQAPRPERWVRE